ncbi:MAG TPA: hypothetical protein VGL05_24365 [Kribbella sp.]
MRLRARDVVALVLLAAVVIPYLGYLGYGEIAMIHTARAMASLSLMLGAIAFCVIRGGHRPAQVGRAEAGAAAFAVLLYFVTVALAETVAAELLLAAFILCLVLVIALDLLDHGTESHR